MQSLQRRALAASGRRSSRVWGLSAQLTGTTGKTAGTSQRVTVCLPGIPGPGHSACQARHGAAEMSLPQLQRISQPQPPVATRFYTPEVVSASRGWLRQAREMLRVWTACCWVVSRAASQGTSQGASHVAGAPACLASSYGRQPGPGSACPAGQSAGLFQAAMQRAPVPFNSCGAASSGRAGGTAGCAAMATMTFPGGSGSWEAL